MQENAARGSKIKVLIVMHTIEKGGVQETIRTSARLLDKRKFTVTVAYVAGDAVSSRMQSIPGVRIAPLETRGRIRRLLRLWEIAREVRPDIVHNHVSWYGLVVGFLAGAKRVETIHSVYDRFTWWQRQWYAVYCLLANRIVAVSEMVSRFTQEHIPLIGNRRMIVIHNGIDVEKCQASSGPDDLRSSMGLSLEEIVIGFVGRLEEQKGVTYLLDAMQQLIQRHHNVTVIIVGDGTLASSLRDKALALHLSNTLFLGYRADAFRYLSLFNIFVLPSLYEGLPLSVLEAMASGCPVVATNVGGVPEIVRNGITGFLVAPKRTDELVDRLEQLIESKDLRLRMGNAGKAHVASNFSAASMVAKTEKLYTSMLSSGSYKRT
jgi:glycosyltransferase involved in cell wall biosynthesis